MDANFCQKQEEEKEYEGKGDFRQVSSVGVSQSTPAYLVKQTPSFPLSAAGVTVAKFSIWQQMTNLTLSTYTCNLAIADGFEHVL